MQGNAGYAQVQGVIHAQSAMLATSEVFWGIAILFGMPIGFVWLTRPPFGVARGARPADTERASPVFAS